MFTKKEIGWLIIAILIAGFIMSISPELMFYPSMILYALVIILVSVLTKNLVASFYSIKIEHKIWYWQRWGWYERSRIKKAFPMGLVFPFFISVLTLGLVKPLTLLQFDVENISHKRALRKRGMYRYSEINDSDIAFTAVWGFYSLVALAIIGYFFNLPLLTKFSIYYGLWNLIPFGQLDGSKVFFGSLINWILLVIIFLISLIMILI